MRKNINNTDGFYDSFDLSSFLEFELDSEFLEWYSVEGSERIGELSRQLRTFLNYKTSIIRLRFSGSQNGNNLIKNDDIIKRESELFSLSSQFTSLLKKIGVEEGELSKEIRNFIDNVKTQPNDVRLKLLKEIKLLCSKIWRNVHLLSELELHNYHQLLHITIKVACILCSVESGFFPVYSDFYKELKHNYLQLEQELSAVLCLSKNERFETMKKKRRVRILE